MTTDDIMKLVDETIDPKDLEPKDAVVFLEELRGHITFRLNSIRAYVETGSLYVS